MCTATKYGVRGFGDSKLSDEQLTKLRELGKKFGSSLIWFAPADGAVCFRNPPYEMREELSERYETLSIYGDMSKDVVFVPRPRN